MIKLGLLIVVVFAFVVGWKMFTNITVPWLRHKARERMARWAYFRIFEDL